MSLADDILDIDKALTGNDREDPPDILAGIYPRDDGSVTFDFIRQAVTATSAEDEEQSAAACIAGLEYARKQASPLLEAWLLCLRANSLATLGLKKEALENASAALSIARANQDDALQARAHFSFAFISLENGELEQAQVMLERSLPFAEAAESDHDMFWALNNLAHIYGEWAEAAVENENDAEFAKNLPLLFQTARRALDVANRTGKWRLRCFALLNLANACFLDQDFKQAQSLITQYGKLARDNNAPRLMAYANLDEARLLAASGLIPDAIKIIESDHHLNDLCATPDLQLRTHDILARFEKDQKNFEKALGHLETARALEREVSMCQTRRHISMLNAQMKMEETQAQAEKLELQAKALELRNQLLEIDREEQRKNAMLDPLTSLGNRRAAEIWMDRHLAQAKDGHGAFLFVFIDVDHFKAVNDEFGHAFGDQVLIAIAEILQGSQRAQDGVFRFGGEEFVIVMDQDNETTGYAICERLRRSIETHAWSDLHPDLKITASFGIAVWRNGETVDALLARADAALYQAKENGRNQVILG